MPWPRSKPGRYIIEIIDHQSQLQYRSMFSNAQKCHEDAKRLFGHLGQVLVIPRRKSTAAQRGAVAAYYKDHPEER